MCALRVLQTPGKLAAFFLPDLGGFLVKLAFFEILKDAFR